MQNGDEALPKNSTDAQASPEIAPPPPQLIL